MLLQPPSALFKLQKTSMQTPHSASSTLSHLHMPYPVAFADHSLYCSRLMLAVEQSNLLLGEEYTEFAKQLARLQEEEQTCRDEGNMVFSEKGRKSRAKGFKKCENGKVSFCSQMRLRKYVPIVLQSSCGL